MTEPTWTEDARGTHAIDLPEGRLGVDPAILGNPCVVHFEPRGVLGMPRQQGWAASAAIAAVGLAAATAGPVPATVDEVAAAGGYVPASTLDLPGRPIRRWRRDVPGGFLMLHVAPEALWLDYEGPRAGWSDTVLNLWTSSDDDRRPVVWPAALGTVEARALAAVAAAAGYDPADFPPPPPELDEDDEEGEDEVA